MVLVGHSYGGAAIYNINNEAGKIKALIFVSAVALEARETAAAPVNKFPGSQVGTSLLPPLDAVPILGCVGR